MTDVEQHRHRCLVRQCLAWSAEHGRAWLRQWLEEHERATRWTQHELRADIVAQWDLGNRGARGDWR